MKHVFLRRALRLGLGLACAFGTVTATAQQAYPAPPSPPVLPYVDPFYASPSADALAGVAPGAVLRYREITAKAYYLFPIKGQAWQLMYRSTDHRGQPVAMVGTVLVPANAPASGRKLVAYNVAYDALTLRCAPSYSFLRGTALEQVLMQSALRDGHVLVVPDYEGLRSLWTVGANSGHGVLDGIRAAQAFAPARLAGRATPVVITGYSGGSLAAAWANELYPSYAPELDIRGVAAGGVPVDLGNVARKVDGKLFGGVYLAASAALARAYPEIPIDELLNDKGKAAMERAGETCLGQFLTGAPDPLLTFFFGRMSRYTTVPDLLQVPVVQRVIAENRMGQRRPGAPMYIYQGTADQLMPLADVDGLVARYCGQGLPVTYKRLFGEHILTAVTGFGQAYAYLSDRLAGLPAPSNCAR